MQESPNKPIVLVTDETDHLSVQEEPKPPKSSLVSDIWDNPFVEEYGISFQNALEKIGNLPLPEDQIVELRMGILRLATAFAEAVQNVLDREKYFVGQFERKIILTAENLSQAAAGSNFSPIKMMEFLNDLAHISKNLTR